MKSGTDIQETEDTNNIQDFFEEIRHSILGDHLDCSAVGLQSVHMNELFTILRNNLQIETLNLSYNNLEDDSSSDKVKSSDKLKEIILSCPYLKEINLRYTRINDAWILNLVNDNRLKERLPTIDFHLDCNRISPKGIKAASDVLSPRSVLTMLLGNQLREKDADFREEIRVKALAAIHKDESPLLKNAMFTTTSKLKKMIITDNNTPPSHQISEDKKFN